MATVDGINRGSASVFELNGDRSVQLGQNGDKFEVWYNLSEEGSHNANSCQCCIMYVCMCDAYGLQKAVPESDVLVSQAKHIT